jgi:hypothetical protein
MTHRHKCPSKFHEGPRTQLHYDHRCTEPRITECIECNDEELAAMGATWETSDPISFSDADPGL